MKRILLCILLLPFAQGVFSQEPYVHTEDNHEAVQLQLALLKKNGVSPRVSHNVLLSHDNNSFPRGAAIREYHAVFEILLPKLRKRGYSQSEINQLTVENPKNAYTVGVRKL